MNPSHNAIGAISDYLAYDGIVISEEEVMKMIDAYMRITLTITNGVCDNTKALSLIFDPTKKINFAEMSDEGLNSIKDYLSNLNSMAEVPFENDEAFAGFLRGRTIVTIFKAIHLFIGIVVGFADKFINDTSASTVAQFRFNCYSDTDDSFIRFTAYPGPDGKPVYHFMSDCLLRVFNEAPVTMV